MRRAVARSVRLTATVRHWFRENGQLWDINLLTAVTAPRTGVEERDLLVCQVEFSLDANHGETTRLILAPRDGFIVRQSRETAEAEMRVTWTPSCGHR